MDENQPRGANNVRVYIRIRPFSDREVKGGNKGIIVCDYEENVVLLKKPPEKSTGKDFDNKYFKLDYIFSPNAVQVSKLSLFRHLHTSIALL